MGSPVANVILSVAKDLLGMAPRPTNGPMLHTVTLPFHGPARRLAGRRPLR
jgi:hypothetical protein